MKTVPLLIALLVGISSAAMDQQQRRPSPVYQPTVTSTGSSSTSLNGPQMRSTSALTTTPMTPPAPLNPAGSSYQQQQPVAQARESIASEASMMQPTVANPSTPSQNYLVYYYPTNGAAPGVAGVGVPAVKAENSSIWSWPGWTDVGAGVGSLALVLIGGGILYTRYGNQVKSRALRELKNLNSEDVSRMTQGVLTALQKLSALNNDTE